MLHNILQHWYQNINHHGGSISPQFTAKMAAWNPRKASFLQDSPDPLEPSTRQREASSIYWLFQDQT